MRAPYHDIENKVEGAIVTYLTATVTEEQLDGAEVAAAVTAGALTGGTRVIVMADKCQGVRGLVGNYLVEATIRLQTKVNPPDERETALSEHRSRLGYIRDAILDDAIADSLSTQETDFTVQGRQDDWSCQTTIEGEEAHWVSELKIQLLCCPQ